MQAAFGSIYDLIENTVPFVLPAAKKFAQEYKDAPVIYVMSSGATQDVAYTFSLCLMMEMQWVNSGNFHDGEFFHGPFEIVDKDVPFLLLMNDGPTRPTVSYTHLRAARACAERPLSLNMLSKIHWCR